MRRQSGGFRVDLRFQFVKVEGRQLHYPQRGQVGEKAFFEEDSEFDLLIFVAALI